MKQDLKRHFDTWEDFENYQPTIWQDPEIAELVERVNDRFEMLLRNAVTVRHEIRTGIRQSDEKILVTIYEWINRFMARTHRYEPIEGVTIGDQTGTIQLHLYEQTMEFIPDALGPGSLI
ncbi:MAG TPA: hypothetical protein GXZ74_01805 [Tissierellia bacterium]|nr:hypothetical protein [Tissierellia bacterium]